MAIDLHGFICKETEKAIGFVADKDADAASTRMLYIPRSKFLYIYEKDQKSRIVQTSEGERIGTPVKVVRVDPEWLAKVSA